jgi:G2/mitotic-specific cyclin 2
LAQFAGYNEEEIMPVFDLMIDYLQAPVAHEALFKKYASKKFLKGKFLSWTLNEKVANCDGASIMSRKWAKDYYSSIQNGASLKDVKNGQ